MAVIVNGERIEDSAIKEEVERLRPQYENVFQEMETKDSEAQLFEWSKENLIERTLLRQEIKKNEPKVPKDRLESIIANLKKEYKDPQELYTEFNVEDEENLKHSVELIIQTQHKFDELYKDISHPSQTAIMEYYKENKEQFLQEEKVKVAHIIKYVNWQTDETTAYQAISQAYNEIQNGAAFEIVVDKQTDCADQGGYLGYITKGQMVEEFDDVVFKLGIDQISNIFRSRLSPLDQVKDQIIKKLTEQMREQAFYSYIDRLKNKAEIDEIK
jgi:parvulin-like peptidyl-prolyl isomerase